MRTTLAHRTRFCTTLDRGAGTVATIGALAALVLVSVGAVAIVGQFIRVTAALRFAEQVAITVAERVVTGDDYPCEPIPDDVTSCSTDAWSATVTVSRGGVAAGATAGTTTP